MSEPIIQAKSPEDEELEKKLAELDQLESELTIRELEISTLQAELQALS